MRFLRWVNRRTGYRGKFLGFLAILDISVGYSLLALSPSQRVVDLSFPYPVWGCLWLVTGVICAVQSMMSKDRPAFTLAAFLKASWAMVYARFVIAGTLPGAWISLIIWLTFAATVMMISSWPEPLQPPVPPVPGEKQ